MTRKAKIQSNYDRFNHDFREIYDYYKLEYHREYVREVLRTLASACEMIHPRSVNGALVSGEVFRSIADRLTVQRIAEVAAAVMARDEKDKQNSGSTTIGNRYFFILGILCRK